MTHGKNDNLLANLMELINENGLEAVTETFRILLNEAMKIERDQALGAALYERTDNRLGYANGYKPKTVDTRMGKLAVDVPQVRGGIQFYPSALEKGCRSERALKLAMAEMYVQGVSTRRVTDVLEKMCGLSVSSTQVSRVASILDEELEKWRNRPLGQYSYLELDAHYEKVRTGGSVVSCAILTAIGVDMDGRRIPPTFPRPPKQVTRRWEKRNNYGLCPFGSILINTNSTRMKRKMQQKLWVN